MSLTKTVNSKSNIKQYSNADLPVQPRQPAIARYAAESTLNQTVISLPFQVDTVNAADSFLLSIDGKVLTPGVLNDFTFTAIDSFGFSSTVTLTQAIPASLNIQAIKLGLKKETEFAQDARFTNLYESQDQAFQGFVRTADVITATTGTPGTGQFYSSISNRASITDLTKDLKVRMGIDRVIVQSIARLQNEFGPNGEPVFAAVNDDRGQIRFVGQWAIGNTTTNGVHPATSNVNDYVEVTFYGTGLNLLTVISNDARDSRVSVDGGAEGSNIFPGSTGSAVLNGRNYQTNSILPVVAGLSLGIHTIKIRINSVYLDVSGFEVLNQSSTLVINPGATYMSGKKATTLAQQSLAYNSTFESGTLSTRGGRVLVYQKSDGTIAKAVTPAGSQLNLTSADHTNEEIARTYHWREFGAGRTDDLSLIAGNGNYAFTLDDGTTTLVASQMTPSSLGGGNNLVFNSNGAYATITFVGTGLDYVRSDTVAGGADTFSATVDGTSLGNYATTGVLGERIQKIVSGLPYGTHTVKLMRTSVPATYDAGIKQFIVYQPKKPTLPSGAVELADYNVMADFAVGTVGVPNISTGVVRKNNTREVSYVNGTGGTSDWTIGIDVVNEASGFSMTSDRTNAYADFIFFGTGVDFRYFAATNRSSSIQISLQNLSTNGSLLAATTTNFATATFSQYGIGSFTSSTGILSQNGTNTGGSGLRISGLPLALYKIRVLNNTASSFVSVTNFDIITPIHSAKSNVYADLQNTLPIGSCAISDNRKTSAIKEALPVQKAWAQAIGTTPSPSPGVTTTATTFVPCPDMSVTLKTNGGRLRIAYSICTLHSVSGASQEFQIYVDGVAVGTEKYTLAPGVSASVDTSDVISIPVSAGVHKVELYWHTSSGILTGYRDYRTLLVEEL